MKRVSLFVALGMACLLASCESGPEGYQIPPQSFAKPLGDGGAERGTFFGKILFSSEYNQRSVVFQIGGRSFVTQPDGRFVVEEIPVGEHWLKAQAKGYEPIAHRFVVKKGRYLHAGDLALRMARGGVVGRLVSETGQSAAEVSVKLAPTGDLAHTDRDGIFQFIAVNKGDHILTISDDQFFTYKRNFSLASGEQRNLGNIQVFRRAGAANLPRTTPVFRAGANRLFASQGAR